MAGEPERVPPAVWVGLDAEMRMYRVNRRPLEKTLFSGEDGLSEDPTIHLTTVLEHVDVVERPQGGDERRRWALGRFVGHEVAGREVLVGTFGYERISRGRSSKFVDGEWVTEPGPREDSDVVPVVYDTETRLLGVIVRRGFGPKAVADVLTTMLRRAEVRARGVSSDREWSVEPVERPEAFYEWVDQTPRVTRLTMAVRLPNPDAREMVDQLMDELKARNAAVQEKTLLASPGGALRGLDHDPEVRQYAAAAEESFGTIHGEGYTAENTKTVYSPSRGQARVGVGPLLGVGAGLAEQLAGALGRFAAKWRQEP
jgi:hypothetical protein